MIIILPSRERIAKRNENKEVRQICSLFAAKAVDQSPFWYSFAVLWRLTSSIGMGYCYIAADNFRRWRISQSVGPPT